MKNLLTLSVIVIIAIDLEKCLPKYLLVNLDDTGEKGYVTRSNRSIDLLNEPKARELSRDESGEWFCLYYIEPQEKGESGALGNPTSQWRYDHAAYWDTVREVVDYKYSGQYMFTDKMGKGLNWLDLKDGMMVKIKAKKVNYPSNEYLQPVPTGYVWFYKLFNDNGEQNWKLHFINDYSTVAFENPTHNNFYLGVGSNKWLEMKSKTQLKWRRTNCPEIWKTPTTSI